MITISTEGKSAPMTNITSSRDSRRFRLNLANSLTAVRIVLAPFITIALVSGLNHRAILAAAIFMAAAFTDFFDGQVARKRQEVTAFGKSFDPLADKVLMVCALVPLSVLGHVPWAATGIIVGREVLVTVLRSLVGHRGGQTGATWLGKAKTGTQTAAIAWAILRDYIGFSEIAIWIAVMMTIISGLHYVWIWVPLLVRKEGEAR